MEHTKEMDPAVSVRIRIHAYPGGKNKNKNIIPRVVNPDWYGPAMNFQRVPDPAEPIQIILRMFRDCKKSTLKKQSTKLFSTIKESVSLNCALARPCVQKKLEF